MVVIALKEFFNTASVNMAHFDKWRVSESSINVFLRLWFRKDVLIYFLGSNNLVIVPFVCLYCE